MNAVPNKTLIVEVALELGIDPAFVEKDWYVVQMIREIIRRLSLLAIDKIPSKHPCHLVKPRMGDLTGRT